MSVGVRAEPPHDVLKRLDRHLGAVQVLEDEDQRLPVADARERAREELVRRAVFVLRPSPRAPAPESARRTGARADLAQDREERHEISREIGEVGPRRAARARVLDRK